MDLNKLLGRYKFVWDMRYSKFKGEPPWAGTREEMLRTLLNKYGISVGLALDIGCGYGDKSIFLESLGFKVFGIDISGVAIKEARKRSERINFICADIRDLGKVTQLRDKQFVLVLDLFTSHFLKNTQKYNYIGAIANLIKPGKYLLLSVYAKDSNTPSDIKRAISPKEIDILYSKYFTILERVRNKAAFDKGNYTDLYVLQRND